MTALLDTNILIDVLRQRNNRHLHLLHFLSRHHRAAVTSVVITEVIMGAVSSKQLRAAEALLNSLQFIPVSSSCARRAGQLYQDWRSRGLTLSLPDLTIAAVCLENNLPLITDNTRHFPMPELKRIVLPFGG